MTRRATCEQRDALFLVICCQIRLEIEAVNVPDIFLHVDRPVVVLEGITARFDAINACPDVDPRSEQTMGQAARAAK